VRRHLLVPALLAPSLAVSHIVDVGHLVPAIPAAKGEQSIISKAGKSFHQQKSWPQTVNALSVAHPRESTLHSCFDLLA